MILSDGVEAFIGFVLFCGVIFAYCYYKIHQQNIPFSEMPPNKSRQRLAIFIMHYMLDYTLYFNHDAKGDSITGRELSDVAKAVTEMSALLEDVDKGKQDSIDLCIAVYGPIVVRTKAFFDKDFAEKGENSQFSSWKKWLDEERPGQYDKLTMP